MVLLGRIELPTSALPRMRSTTELQQPTIFANSPGLMVGRRRRAIAGGLGVCQADGVTQPPPKLTREDRLAAQLRANLRRRKEQAREMSREDSPSSKSSPADPDPSQTE